jgi:hypothetical protein
MTLGVQPGRHPPDAICITHDASPLALLSTRNRLRTAVRRGAAWPPAERPSGWPGSAARSLARWQVASPPSRHGCRAPRVPPPPQQYGSLSSGVVVPGCPDAHRALVALSASACPASARPVSGVRYASSVRASGVRCPVSARPVSDVQCPVPGVHVRCPVRASAIRVHSVRTGEFVEQVGATGSHTTRDTSVG